MAWKHNLMALAATCCLSATAIAGTIGYRFGFGGPTQTITVPPDLNIEIPIGNVTANTYLHIFDIVNATDPVDSLGIITLRGTATDSLPFRPVVYVVIAAESLPSVTDAFSQPDLFILPGLRNLGSIRLLPPDTDPTNFSLRDHAALSVNVLGDITGDITAGALFRVDALRSDSDPNPALHFGGTISANLRTTRGDGQAFGGVGGLTNPSIGYIRAGWQISGDITADGERDAAGVPLFNILAPGTWGSAQQIIVGPSLIAPGIQGNINCEYGRIREILCTGSIGTGPEPANRSEITAGFRIGRITMRAQMEEGDASLQPRPIYADIDASARNLIYRQENGPDTTLGSSMTILETAGDFAGTIKLHDFYGRNANEFSGRSTLRKGIFVGGSFTGDISVTYSYEYGDMIARSFRGDINIGQMLKGAIVAVGTEGSTDPLDGTINLVKVGYHPDLSGAPRANGSGIIGVETSRSQPPFEGVSRNAWYTMDQADFHIADSIIRADKSIGEVRIKSMSNRLSATSEKFARPRVESPVITTLRVDNFDCGVIWSGKLNSTTAAVTNDITDDYASTGTLTIGCMGPKADLWIKNTYTIDITGDMFGEVHVPRLAPAQVLRIGGRFGDLTQALSTVALCQAQPDFEIDGLAGFENSPRATWAAIENNQSPNFSGIAGYGRILIRQPLGLEGQIVLDGFNTGAQRPTTHWRGDVEVGTGDATDPNLPGTPLVISTNAGRATTGLLGPNYSLASGAVGGGAVGLVDYHLYDNDSAPIAGAVPIILQSRFSGRNGLPVDSIKLRFYGPVFTEATCVGECDFMTPANCKSPVKVEMLMPNNVWMDVTKFCKVTLNRSAGAIASRTVEIQGCTTHVFPATNYRITPIRGLNPGPEFTRLLCDRTFLAAPPAVADFTYLFVLLSDCNENGVLDDSELSSTTDVNNDGILDECVDGVCIADVDDGSFTGTPDGGVTIEDLLYYLFIFDQGLVAADVDDGSGTGTPDSGVTIDDLLYFLFRYDIGC